MFRFKSGVKVGYNRQGYIYFTSRLYKDLPEEDQRVILNLCLEHGGESYQALFEFVTTDATATAVCMKHCLSKSTLHRMVRRYYEDFPKSYNSGNEKRDCRRAALLFVQGAEKVDTS